MVSQDPVIERACLFCYSSLKGLIQSIQQPTWSQCSVLLLPLQGIPELASVNCVLSHTVLQAAH